MSVIVRKSGTKDLQVYVKGAPEIMSDICQQSTCILLTFFLPPRPLLIHPYLCSLWMYFNILVPSDYEEMLDFYTHHGYRVIALAAKSLPNISTKRAQRMKRQEAEAELVFLGFIVFENKLKPSTPGILTQLRDARIRRVM